MIRVLNPLALTVMSVLVTSVASADICQYRSADLQLSAIAAEARDLRWDIAVAPIRESDRRTWVRGLDDIYDEIMDLQKGLFRNRTPQFLCRQVEDLREEICELRDDLTRLGRPISFRHERSLTGARFRCGIFPGGCVLPNGFIDRLAALDQRAAVLHDAIAAVGSGVVPGHFSTGPFDPSHLSPAPFGSPGFGNPPAITLPPAAPYSNQPPLAVPLPAPRFDEPTTNFDRRSRGQRAMSALDWILSQL